MEPNYKLQNGYYTVFKFPSGEINVQTHCDAIETTITGSPQSSDDIMELLCLVDALRRDGTTNLILIMPYVMYSRDDRVMQEGQQLGINVFAKLINSCNFRRVYTIDNHSDVATAVIDNCENLGKRIDIIDLTRYDYVVAPDAGSIKGIQKISTHYQIPMLRADKTRDIKTGDITGTIVYAEDIQNAKVLILDDICQGGRTFFELAKVLKSKGCSIVDLYITHGFFSSGLEVLLENGIDHIYTTDSVCNIENKHLTII